MPDEHGPPLGIRRSAVLQIFGHSMSNIGGKGHSLITIAGYPDFCVEGGFR